MVTVQFPDAVESVAVGTVEQARQYLSEQGMYGGADYVNEDGVRVIEYWPTAEQARGEQSCPAPACIAITTDDAPCPECGAQPVPARRIPGCPTGGGEYE